MRDDTKLAALELIVEDMLDDLIEAGNTFELDHEWRCRRINDLLDARDKPAEFLARRGANL